MPSTWTLDKGQDMDHNITNSKLRPRSHKGAGPLVRADSHSATNFWLEYYVEHCRGNLLIVTNDREALDYKLVQTIPESGGEGALRGCGRDTVGPVGARAGMQD